MHFESAAIYRLNGGERNEEVEKSTKQHSSAVDGASRSGTEPK
jgi:hypothetical protein